jgi:hypothetical protein
MRNLTICVPPVDHLGAQLTCQWCPMTEGTVRRRQKSYARPPRLMASAYPVFSASTICSVAASGCARRIGGIRNWIQRQLATESEIVLRTRRSIIVFIAASADGYIARPNGDVEWLNRRPRTADYGMNAFCPTIDTIPHLDDGRRRTDGLVP